MNDIHFFITGFLLSLSLCLDIGIVNVAIIKTGFQKGTRLAFMVGLGSCFGDLIYMCLSIAGMAFILKIAVFKWIFWIGGVGMLLYLAYKHIIEIRKELSLQIQDQTKEEGHHYFKNGLILALSSPSAIIWFATIFGSFLASNPIKTPFAYLFFALGFFFAGLVWSYGIALFTGKTRHLFSSSILKVINILSALLFLYFAIKIAIDGYTELVIK